jgi:hypothetical protein
MRQIAQALFDPQQADHRKSGHLKSPRCLRLRNER